MLREVGRLREISFRAVGEGTGNAFDLDVFDEHYHHLFVWQLRVRRDDVRHFAGKYTHHLKKTKSGYAIKLQRVDMTNAQAAYDYVLQVWV